MEYNGDMEWSGGLLVTVFQPVVEWVYSIACCTVVTFQLIPLRNKKLLEVCENLVQTG